MKNWVALISVCIILKGPVACSQADINKASRETGGVGQSPRDGTEGQRKGGQRRSWNILDCLVEHTPTKISSGSLPSSAVPLKLPIHSVITKTLKKTPTDNEISSLKGNVVTEAPSLFTLIDPPWGSISKTDRVHSAPTNQAGRHFFHHSSPTLPPLAFICKNMSL